MDFLVLAFSPCQINVNLAEPCGMSGLMGLNDRVRTTSAPLLLETSKVTNQHYRSGITTMLNRILVELIEMELKASRAHRV
jgi:hypothetical protein